MSEGSSKVHLSLYFVVDLALTNFAKFSPKDY